MKYTGIDLHSNNSVISVINETDKVVAENRLPNDLARILEFLEPHKADMAGLVVESTYNWYWLVDDLQEAGYTVHLANTTAIKKYEGLKHSGDVTDARHLAHFLRLGILPTRTILPPERANMTMNAQSVLTELKLNMPALIAALRRHCWYRQWHRSCFFMQRQVHRHPYRQQLQSITIRLATHRTELTLLIQVAPLVQLIGINAVSHGH